MVLHVCRRAESCYAHLAVSDCSQVPEAPKPAAAADAGMQKEASQAATSTR